MDWLALALGFVKLLGALTGWLHDRQLLSAGGARQLAEALQAQADALKTATNAREAVRADAARNPERVPDDDGFRRD